MAMAANGSVVVGGGGATAPILERGEGNYEIF
jgi:hypothetical protein